MEKVGIFKGDFNNCVQAVAHVAKIGEISELIFHSADTEGILTNTAADRVAEQLFGMLNASKAA